MSAHRRTGLLLLFGLSLAACNMVTGADDYVILEEQDDDTSDSSGPSGNGGSSNASTGSETGAGGTSTVSTGAGAQGGASSSSEASASSSASTAASTSASTSASSAMSSSSSSASSGGGEMCGGAGPTTTPLDTDEQAFMILINDYRAQNGLGALTPCISLNRAAQGHSEDMRDNNYFSHTGLNNSSPWDRACDACFDKGCGPTTAMAENIAAGNSGAQGTFDQWKNSPGHNANMLGSSFTMIGVGRASGGGQYGTYWTNVFAGSDEASCY